MEMLQLRYFYESAITESFAKTAQKYMVPASSVSASVKRLEQELGTELFARKGNRIELNESGRRLLDTVGNTLTQLDVTVNAIAQQSAEEQTISVLARCTRETLALWTTKFYRMYPSVSFRMVFDDAPKNFGKYDIIVSSPESALEDYSSFPWRKYAIRVEALDTDPLCRGPVTLDQLRDRSFVTTSTQGGGFKVFTKACERRGFEPKVFLECDDYGCRTKALRTGVCLGLNLARWDESARNSDTRFLAITDFTEELPINVYYKQERCVGNVKLLLDMLKSSVTR